MELREAFGIEFSGLLCLNNMPIKRYVDFLQRRGQLHEYMQARAALRANATPPSPCFGTALTWKRDLAWAYPACRGSRRPCESAVSWRGGAGQSAAAGRACRVHASSELKRGPSLPALGGRSAAPRAPLLVGSFGHRRCALCRIAKGVDRRSARAAAGEQLQRGCRGGRDVPRHRQRRMGRPPVRLRFQPAAGARAAVRPLRYSALCSHTLLWEHARSSSWRLACCAAWCLAQYHSGLQYTSARSVKICRPVWIARMHDAPILKMGGGCSSHNRRNRVK